MSRLTKKKQYRSLYKLIYTSNATDQVISNKHVKCVLKSRLLDVVLMRTEFFMHVYGYKGQEHHLVWNKIILIHFDIQIYTSFLGFHFI